MRTIRIIALSALMTLAVAALSRAPYTPPGARDAVLRFSWRMSVTAQENCRQRTREELEALPVHMRTPQECTRDRASYVLITRIDGGDADTLELLRGGVKGDRPLFVLEERRMVPGRHRVSVELQRTAAPATPRAGGAAPEAQRPAILARLDTTLLLESGGVQLVTLDEEGRRLVVRSSR